MRALVQAKGQVTLPKPAREEMGLKPGDEVVWVKNAEGRWEVWTYRDLVDDLTKDADAFRSWLRRAKKGLRPKGT